MPATAPIRPDSYYVDASRAALDQVLIETDGKDLEEVRFLLHRAYPFGANRNGRPYKIFRKELLDVEDRLGFERRTNNRNLREEVEEKKIDAYKTSSLKEHFVPPATKAELLRQYPTPETIQDAAHFLRKFCKATITMEVDFDKLKIVLKQSNVAEHRLSYQYIVELETSDPEDYNDTYLVAAKAMHKVWLENELAKY
jgi:hypothetical protein